MRRKYTSTNERRSLRRKMFELVRERQRVEQELYRYDSVDDLDNIEAVMLSARRDDLGREIDSVNDRLLQVLSHA